MISPGAKPDLVFRVKVVEGAAVREVEFHELLLRRTIVSVYMKNKTPSCDRQTASLAQSAAEFAAAGYGVVAVSRDTTGSHRRRVEAEGIGFPLVSDPHDLFARATDSLVEKSMYGRTFVGPQRAAYVLAPDGEVLAVVPKVDTADHAAQLRELIKSL